MQSKHAGLAEGVLRRGKDRTKTQEDRDVELCPRANEVLRRHLALRAEYVAAGKIRHEHLFFLEGGRPISDSEITRWRWSESIKALNIQRRGPYHARHSSVTWQLILLSHLCCFCHRCFHARPHELYEL